MEDIELDGAELQPGLMIDPANTLAFMFAGDATLTFKSLKSGNRYTYRIQVGDLRESDKRQGGKAPFFVRILTGSDNENDYTYMGMITFWNGKPAFRLTAASFRAHLTEEDRRVKAFRWTFDSLINGKVPLGVEVWHEGRCSRCRRKLTDSESIKRGFGPTCFELMGGDAYISKFASEVLSINPPAPVNPASRTYSEPHTVVAPVVESTPRKAEMAKVAEFSLDTLPID